MSLHEAISCGDVARVHEILGRDASSINDGDPKFYTPLMYLIQCHSVNLTSLNNVLAIFKLLTDYGADVNVRGGHDLNSALILAVQLKMIVFARLLLEAGADPNIKNKSDHTALHYAVKSDDGRITELLLNHGADTDVFDFQGNTPLDTAVTSCSIISAEKLIESGAESGNVYKLLLRACTDVSCQMDKHKYKEFVAKLLDNGRKMDGNFSLRALLYHAVSEKHENRHYWEKCFILEFLNERGVYVNDDAGDSELHLAVRETNFTRVEALLLSGADVNLKNVYGEAPLHLLLKDKEPNRDKELQENIARLLIAYGTDLGSHNYINETPFFLATKNCNNVINLMLAKITGVNETTLNRTYTKNHLLAPFYKDEPKLHELIVSINLGYEQVVDRLLNMSFIQEASKTRCRDFNEALKEAVNSNHYRIVKMLFEAGFRTDERYNHVLHQLTYRPVNIGIRMKMECLLWEFQDIATVNLLLVDTLQSIGGWPTADTFQKLFVFYYMINSQFVGSNADLVPMKGLLNSTHLSCIISDCNEKLDELKEMKAGDKSMFDILTMPLDALAGLFNNEDCLKGCTDLLLSLEKKVELEYHEYALVTHIELAMEKMRVLRAARDNLKEAFRGILETINYVSLDDHIMLNILAHLDVRELKKIA